MPYRFALLSLLFLGVGAVCRGQSNTSDQQSIQVHFTEGYDLPEGTRRGAFGFMVPVRLNHNRFTYRDTVHTVVLPPHMDLDSAAIADEFNRSNLSSRYATVSWYLIYPYPSARPTLYVDSTDAFDFTSAPAFPFRPRDTAWITEIARKDDPGCLVVGQFEPPAFNDEMTKADVEKYFGQLGSLNRNNENIDADHWLRAKRRNFRYGGFTYDDVDYRIALYDYNYNGHYADSADRVLINVSGPLSEELSEDAYAYAPNTVIGAGGQAFRVADLTTCGESITLVPVDTVYNRNGLRVGGRLADLDEMLDLGDGVDFRNFQPEKEYLVLDFWGSWCGPCMAVIPEVREFYAEYSDRVQLIGMNLGDTDAAIAALREKHDMAWPSYRVTDPQATYLGVDGYPTYLLLSREGELLLSSSRLSDLVQRIQN